MILSYVLHVKTLSVIFSNNYTIRHKVHLLPLEMCLSVALQGRNMRKEYRDYRLNE